MNMNREEKKRISLRISVTPRCQLRCLYCQPDRPRRTEEKWLGVEEILRFVRAVQTRFAIAKIHLTGGEPLLWPGILFLIEKLTDEGIAGLALTTNGQLLSEKASDLKNAGLKRVNISLDAIEEKSFRSLTGTGELRRTLDGIDAALDSGLDPVKLNTVVMKGRNDDQILPVARFGLDRNCRVRFMELMPIGCIRPRFHEFFVSSSDVRSRLRKFFTLEAIPYNKGQSSRYFSARESSGRRGTIGFISPETEPFCEGCTRIRLTADGTLISCLARGTGPNIKKHLQNDSPYSVRSLKKTVETALAEKCDPAPISHFETARPMTTVGG